MREDNHKSLPAVHPMVLAYMIASIVALIVIIVIIVNVSAKAWS